MGDTAVTVHIAVPRRLWYDEPLLRVHDAESDALLGRFIRDATEDGRCQVSRRVNGPVQVHHIEITLTDGVSAMVEG